MRMDNWGQRFSLAVYVFAAIGLVSVLGIGAFGVVRLVRFRADAAISPETASVAADAGNATNTASAGQAALTPPPAAEPVPPAVVTRRPAPVLSPALGARADLAIQIIDTGIIEPSSGQFRHAESINLGDQPAVVFDVTNLGSVRSEGWQFSVNLPTFAGLYTPPDQQPLNPGERIRFTLGFRNLVRTGSNTVTITLDPANRVSDSNRANDVATATFTRGY